MVREQMADPAPYLVRKVTWAERWEDFRNPRYGWLQQLDCLLFRNWDVIGPDGLFNSYALHSNAERQAIYMSLHYYRGSS